MVQESRSCYGLKKNFIQNKTLLCLNTYLVICSELFCKYLFAIIQPTGFKRYFIPDYIFGQGWIVGNGRSEELRTPTPTDTYKLSLPFSITRRYGPLRGPTSSSCGGLRPSPEAFLPFGQKESLLCCFGPFLAIFCVQ